MRLALFSRFIVVMVVIFVCARQASFAYDELHLKPAFAVVRDPEVLADTVIRTKNTKEFPLLLLVRHSDKFPVILKSVHIEVKTAEGDSLYDGVVEKDLKLKTSLWHENATVTLDREFTGDAEVNVTFNLKTKHGEVKVVNNNTKETIDKTLRIRMGAGKLPGAEGWYYGDTHFHTIYSDNQVEFGAPIDSSAIMAAAYGVDWLVFTDHSFDLDDVDGDTTKNDSATARWFRMKNETSEAAKTFPNMLIVAGEELSCGNAEGANVHMLVYDSPFFPGNGDGYEGSKTPDLQCEKVISEVNGKGASGAAHPVVPLSSVEIYMINRGNWSDMDIAVDGMTFDQAWNYTMKPRQEGFDQWVRTILNGRRLPLAGGTDAHGDFNYSYIGWPENIPFAGIRTAVKVNGELTMASLAEGLRAGRMIATSGPFVDFDIVNGEMRKAGIGDTITPGKLMVEFRALSSSEYGALSEVRIYAGDIDKNSEELLTTYFGKYAENPMNMEDSLMLPDIKNGYVRVECDAVKHGFTYRAYANPIWIK